MYLEGLMAQQGTLQHNKFSDFDQHKFYALYKNIALIFIYINKEISNENYCLYILSNY